MWFGLCVSAVLGLGFSSGAFAAGGSEIIDYYSIILAKLTSLDSHHIEDWKPTIGAIMTLILLALVGKSYQSSVQSKFDESVVPDHKFSVRSVVEMILNFVFSFTQDVLGKEKGPGFFPFLAGIFLFIFVSNLTGLVPGFFPATDSLNTNLGIGLVVFFTYNFYGIKEHGLSYVKQFTGPILFIMPLMLIIELVAHIARPISLSLRLYGNIFGDHLVLSVFTGLTVLVFPAFLLFFGLLVASLQSFVFALLSGIYISMAVSHDH